MNDSKLHSIDKLFTFRIFFLGEKLRKMVNFLVRHLLHKSYTHIPIVYPYPRWVQCTSLFQPLQSKCKSYLLYIYLVLNMIRINKVSFLVLYFSLIHHSPLLAHGRKVVEKDTLHILFCCRILFLKLDKIGFDKCQGTSLMCHH